MYSLNATLNFVIIVMVYFNLYKFLEEKTMLRKYKKYIICAIIIIFTIVNLLFYELSLICYIGIIESSIILLFKNPIYEKVLISLFLYIIEVINISLAITIIFIFKDVGFLKGAEGIVLLFIILGWLLFISQILLLKLYRNKGFRLVFRKLKYRIYLVLMTFILYLVAILPVTLQKFSLFSYRYTPWISLIFTCLIIALMICFYYLIKFGIYKKELIERYEEKSIELESLIQSIEEKNVFDNKRARVIHDMKNHNVILESLMEKGNFNEALDYINEFNEKIREVENKNITTNLILNTILSNKREMAISKGITIEISCNVFKEMKISSFDLTTVFGNLIDNAIEENERNSEKNKFIKIKIYMENEMLFFFIENSMEKFEKINRSLLKTRKDKKDNHGLGLKNVREVIKKYNGAIEFKEENFIFITRGYFNLENKY